MVLLQQRRIGKISSLVFKIVLTSMLFHSEWHQRPKVTHELSFLSMATTSRYCIRYVVFLPCLKLCRNDTTGATHASLSTSISSFYNRSSSEQISNILGPVLLFQCNHLQLILSFMCMLGSNVKSSSALWQALASCNFYKQEQTTVCC